MLLSIKFGLDRWMTAYVLVAGLSCVTGIATSLTPVAGLRHANTCFLLILVSLVSAVRRAGAALVRQRRLGSRGRPFASLRAGRRRSISRDDAALDRLESADRTMRVIGATRMSARTHQDAWAYGSCSTPTYPVWVGAVLKWHSGRPSFYPVFRGKLRLRN